MRKNHILIRCVVLVLICSYFIVPQVVDYIKTEKTYGRCFSTPEEAIETVLETDDYVYVIDNGLGLSLCNTNVNNYAYQLLYESDEGWQVITGRIFRKKSYFKTIEKNDGDNFKYDGDIFIRKYKDKYYFGVSQKIYSDDTILFSIRDSINTKFEEMEYESIYKEHYWFWCLDKIPDDYQVVVDGEVVFKKSMLKTGRFFVLS